MEPTQHPTPISLIVNAGGPSLRMGRPKALLPVPPAGRPLIQHIVQRLLPLVSGRLVLVTAATAVAQAVTAEVETVCMADDLPHGGALGGILTGLRASPGWAMLVGCDMPLVQPALFALLCRLATETLTADSQPWDAVVPLVAGRHQTHHALYHPRCLPAIAQRLDAGILRVASFLPDVRTRIVAEHELQPLDSQLHSFFNANTPSEWTEAVRLLALEGADQS